MAFKEPDRPSPLMEESIWGFLQNVMGGPPTVEEKIVAPRLTEWMALVQLLQDVTAAANESISVEEAVQFVLNRICEHTGWPIGHVYFPTTGTPPTLCPADIWHLADEERFDPFRQVMQTISFAPDQGLPGRVFASGEPMWMMEATQDPNLSRAEMAKTYGVEAGFAFPVWAGAEVVGVLEFFSTVTVEPTGSLMEVMTHIGMQLGRVIERERAEDRLRARERQLAEAERLAHLGSWRWEIATNEISWSEELYRVYGLTPQNFEASFEGFLERVHPDDRNLVRKKIEEAYDSSQPFNFEHRIVRPDGTVRVLQARGRVVRDESGQPVRMVGTDQDITEQKEIEQAINEGKTRFEGLFEAAPDATVLVNKKGRIVRVNRQTEAMFGYSREEIVGQPVEMLMPPRFREQHILHRIIYHSDPHLRPMGAEMKLYGYRQDGAEFPVEITLSPLQTKDDVLVIGVIHDITRRKRMEADLAEVQHRLMENREGERLHIAQELHDGPLQDLNGVAYQLNEIWETLPDDESRGQLIKTQVTLQRVIKFLRVMCGELRPPALAPFGLEKAIRSHAAHFQKEHPALTMQLDLAADGQTLPEQIRLALFRIYQQALHNIIKHAGAKRITIRFEINESHIILEVEDDGCGFKVPQRRVELARQGHLGIVGATERAEAIGGRLDVTSTPGQGTLIRAIAPRVRSENLI